MDNILKIIRKTEREAKEIEISPEELASIIDHTELSPYKTESSLRELCEEAKSNHFSTVCVNPYYTDFCAKRLEKTEIKVSTTIGFPLGQTTSEEKAYEAKEAVSNGTSEIDMVMNIGAFKDEKYDFVKEDIKKVVDTVGDILVKVIIESGYLNYEEVTKASELVKEAGADFVKNATGFGPAGANIPHICLMRNAVGKDFGVKAAGGIRDFRDALMMIAAGANRIGTSSGVEIVDGYRQTGHTDWLIEESPCRFCLSQMVSSAKVPEKIFQYYKGSCEDCAYEKQTGKD